MRENDPSNANNRAHGLARPAMPQNSAAHLGFFVRLIRIFGNDPFPLLLRLQNHFHDLADRAVSAGRFRHVICRRFGFRHAIAHRNAQPHPFQHRDVHHVVADVTDIPPIHTGLTQNALNSLNLSAVMLDKKIDFQIFRALLRRARRPARNPADFDSVQLQKFQAKPVTNVKPLHFHAATHINGAVGQHAIYVAEEQSDAFEFSEKSG